MKLKPILIVEDDRDIRECLRELFEGDGYVVYLAGNGLEAIDLLLKTNEQPGIIFLDLMMPVMDGQTFLKQRMTLSSSIASIPVLIVSAAAAADSISGIEGVVGTMKKPIEIDIAASWAAQFCQAKAS